MTYDSLVEAGYTHTEAERWCEFIARHPLGPEYAVSIMRLKVHMEKGQRI